MTRPIPDKAEVALEYPDKLYIGTFERSGRFDAHLDESGISLTLDRAGDAETRKSVHMHFHYALFADILRELANTVSKMPPDDAAHREALRAGATELCRALSGDEMSGHGWGRDASQHCGRHKQDDISELTPEEEEVLLLHVLE